MHNFYYANTFINFSSIYCWTFACLLLDYYLSIYCGGSSFVLCASLSLQEVFLGPYYDIC